MGVMLILMVGGVWLMKASKLAAPRGVRANNPLNIEINRANAWRGKVVPSVDKRFETFEHHKFGFRAGAVLLRNYQRLHGLYTVEAMIHRFAPPNENKTSNYVKFVADRMGVGVREPVDLQDNETLARMLDAMATMEVGHGFYSLDDARQGVALA